MGAWGHGTFENDDASDWVYELEGSEDFEVVEAAFKAVNDPEGDDLESWDCCNALAAAEVVAAMLGRSVRDLPQEIANWVKGRGLPTPELIASALTAIDRILRDSELKDLWEDADEPGWQASVLELRARVAA